MTSLSYCNIPTAINRYGVTSAVELQILAWAAALTSGLRQSNRDLAELLHTDRRTIINSINRLKEKGLITNAGTKYARVLIANSEIVSLFNSESLSLLPVPDSESLSPLPVPKGERVSQKGEKPDTHNIKNKEEEEVYVLWNSNPKLPKARKLTTQLRSHLKARLSEPEFSQHWQEIITTIANTPFLCGDSQRGWKADFDWFIKNDTNYLKVLEGKYAANGKPAAPPEKEFIPGEIGPDGLAICGEPTEEYARKLLGSL